MFPVINKKETGIRFRKLMDQRGITVKDIQNYLGFASVQSIYHWLNGQSMPTMDNMYALSALFRVSIDEMLCGNRPLILPGILSEREASYYERIYLYYRKVQDTQALLYTQDLITLLSRCVRT